MLENRASLTVKDGVAHLRLRRGSKGNAIDLELARAFADCVRRAAEPDIGALIVSGEGANFCVGGDLAAIQSAPDPATYVQTLAVTMDAALVELGDLRCPVVAAISGAVAGAGIGLMLAADIVVSAADTRITMAYSRVGLTPDCGVSYHLVQALGIRHALDFALLDRTLDAQTAQEVGLVNEIAEGDPLERANEVAVLWAAASYRALGTTRQLIRRATAAGRHQSGRDESVAISAAVDGADSKRCIDAFLKPKPA